ncbi:MAG: MFS transporter [Planctomycetota bacterium]
MSRKPLLIIFITVFIDLLGFAIVLPLLPRYGRHFEATKFELGLLMASFSAMQFLFAPLWGRLSDRIGRRPVLIVGLAGSTIFYTLFALVTQYGNAGPILGLSPLIWLFITRSGAGIAGATIPTAQAYIADSTDEKSRGKGMAIIGAAFGIGFTFGPLLGACFVPGSAANVLVDGAASQTVVMSDVPSAAPGYVAAVLSAIATLAAITMLPESLKPGASPRLARKWFDVSALSKAIGLPHVGLLLATIFLTTFAFAQFETTLSALTEELGVDNRNNFFVFAYIGFILTLAQGLLVRRMLPKLGEFRMAMLGAVLMTLGLGLIGVASQQGAVSLLWYVLPISVVGFAATTPSLQSLLSLNIRDDQQGEMLGVGQSMSSLARILGPVAGMSLQKYGLSLPYWSAAGLMAVGVLMVLGLRSAAIGSSRAETAPIGH